MTRNQLKRGLQAAAWLRERLCTRRSPSIAGLTEGNVLHSNLQTTKNPFRTNGFCGQSTRPPLFATEESIAKRNSQVSQSPISRIFQRHFHTTRTEYPSVRTIAHRTGLSSSSLRLLMSARPFAKSVRGFRISSDGELQNFQRKGFYGGRRSPRQYLLIGIATTGLCVSVYLTNREVVPYTYRKHFVLIPPDYEAEMVQSQFQALKDQWKNDILSPYHPEYIRVRRIAKDIIRAVLEGVQPEHSYSTQLGHGDKVRAPKQDDIDVLVRRANVNFPVSAQWGNKDEVLDDQWMDETRKKGLQQGSKPYVEHLKNTKWEVLVVDKDIVNAFCLPGGKIVVFTGLIRRFPSDQEIATVLGHEVAHVVARHSAERMTRHLYLTLIQLFLLAFLYAPDIVQALSVLFLELPFSRRQELEADHIGLLLMAAAGYDPRAAPQVYEKLGELGGTSAELLQYITTHPSGKKRGERLRTTGTMEEAMRIYTEKVHGTVTEGFLRVF